MHPLLTAFLARQEESGYADLAGTDLRLRVPVREGVINDLLARTVLATQPAIRALDVTIDEDNLVQVGFVSTAIPLAPRLTFELVVDHQLMLTSSPTLTLFLVRRRLTRLLAIALPWLDKLLPPFVSRAEASFAIDVGMLLQQQGLEQLIPFIHAAEFTSERGVIWVDLHLAVSLPRG
jgi:hypothetical protein